MFHASGSKSNSMIESLKILLERGMTKAKLKPQSVRKQQLHILSRTERHLVIFLTWTIFMVCLCSDMITEWSCFSLDPSWLQRVLSDVDVLWNCLCATGEFHGLVCDCQINSYNTKSDSPRPTSRCQGLLSLSQKRRRGKQRSGWMRFLWGNLGREFLLSMQEK